MSAVHVIVVGRVQGVGFRAWVEHEARARRLAGWVRNRADGSVEALVQGDDESVAALVAWARRGPRLAHVDDVRDDPVTPAHDRPYADFAIWPSA